MCLLKVFFPIIAAAPYNWGHDDFHPDPIVCNPSAVIVRPPDTMFPGRFPIDAGKYAT